VPAFDPLFAGIFQGTTSQGEPLEFAVDVDGTLRGFRVTMEMSLAGATCTGPFTARTRPVSVPEFSVPVKFITGNVATVFHGTFENVDSVSGTYDDAPNGYALLCGSSLSIGTGVTFGAGTWTATRCRTCPDACEYANDNYCDEPRGGTGLCFLGTDGHDCCSTPENSVCDEVTGGGVCSDRRDWVDCGYCPFTNDGVCDEPDLCPPGTDSDCSAEPEPEPPTGALSGGCLSCAGDACAELMPVCLAAPACAACLPDYRAPACAGDPEFFNLMDCACSACIDDCGVACGEG
jgi:hypothetical protein